MQFLSPQISIATEPAHMAGILALQASNIPETLSPKEMLDQGFVTVRHTVDLLSKMAKLTPQFIALAEGEVVGYVLSMDSSLKKDIPVLWSMFDEFERVRYRGRSVSSYSYIVCGQACISKKYRGMGLLGKLYSEMKARLAESYSFCITDIAVSNIRSMKAHEKIGFQTIHTYWDGMEYWNMVLWDWETPLDN